MSEYYFSVFTGVQMTNGRSITIPGGKTAAKKRDRIARRVGGKKCGYVYYFDAARREWRGWGYVPNRGEPFDRAIAREIEAAWAASGV